MCVLNRRGRARLLACRTCGELARCERCGATVEQRDARARRARACATVRPLVCLHCHGSTFRAVRPGIAHVRDDLAALLPRTDVGAVDAATDDVPERRVLIGTEAVLHRVAGRRSAWSRTSSSTRSCSRRGPVPPSRRSGCSCGAPGCSATGGRLLVQTRLPDHEVVRRRSRSAPMLVAEAERARRRALGFPPFGGLAELSGAADAVAAACARRAPTAG